MGCRRLARLEPIQQNPVPYGPHNHLNPTQVRASAGARERSMGRAPSACEALTTNVTPWDLQMAPSASRSMAYPENEWTHVVQNSLVRGVMAASSSSGDIT